MSIIEFVVVLVASALLMVQGIKDDIAHRRTQLLTVEGQTEAVLNAAYSKWVTNNYSNLIAQLVDPGPTVLTPPTIDQLYQSGYLKQHYATGPFWGGTYDVQMSVGPANCRSSADGCHVNYVFYPSQPVMRDGRPDVVGASVIAQAAAASDTAYGDSFGYSSAQNPGTVNGLNGAWHAANPVSGTPAAVVMATNGPSTDGTSLYIRRDGSLTWTGSQNVNGVDLHNVGNIDAEGTVAAPTLAASNVAVSNAVRTPGTLNVQNAAGTAPAPISTGNATVAGSLQATQTIMPGAVAVPRSYCATNGQAATNSDGSGQWLSCQYHEWLPIGGTALRYNYYLVGNGSWVPAPPCSSGGTPQIVVTRQNMTVDTTATVNISTSGSGPWNTWFTNGSGAGTNATGVAETYCAY